MTLQGFSSLWIGVLEGKLEKLIISPCFIRGKTCRGGPEFSRLGYDYINNHFNGLRIL